MPKSSNRRQQIALTKQEQDDLLEKSLTIILSTLDPHGYPHSVPMWFVVRDGRVQMTTYSKSQKVKNLERDPRCSLLIEDGTEYQTLRGILIRGRAAVQHDVDAVLDMLVEIQRKHGLQGTASELRDAMRGAASKRALLTIEPVRISSWDHRKLGGAY